jgi:HlyD family secretion protein
MKRFIRKAMLPAAILAVIAVAAFWLMGGDSPSGARFRTAELSKGDLVITINATGTLEPEEVVDVGSQVTGQILSFGLDTNGKSVDYRSPVEKGAVLAKIDDATYLADKVKAEAQVKSEKAGLEKAKADLAEARAELRKAERNWNRAKKLGPSQALSQASYDSYQSEYETAKAGVTVAMAAVHQAEASVVKAEAALQAAERSLGFCTITSPVTGVVIDRRVNIGQTVVSSMSTTSLFLIAKDLKRMQVWVAVNEADIGKIRAGQPVVFTADAFPGHTFTGEVNKVRLNASMTQNVVTYTVEVSTDNSSGLLLPYLTANVEFEVDRKKDVFMAPKAALRWAPISADQVVSEPEPSQQPSEPPAGRAPRGPASAENGSNGSGGNWGVIWTTEGDKVRPIQVRVGESNDMLTAVRGPGLSAGMPVVTGVMTAAEIQKNTSNPFLPQRPSRKRRSGPPHR